MDLLCGVAGGLAVNTLATLARTPHFHFGRSHQSRTFTVDNEDILQLIWYRQVLLTATAEWNILMVL